MDDAQIGLNRPTAFTLTIATTKVAGKLHRRQNVAFVDYKGRSTSSCSQASTYYIINGQLLVQYANATVAEFSANSGDPYTVFAPSTSPGNIVTTFSVSNSGSLLWNNDAFFNGGALFCILPSGDLVAVFVQGAQPETCIFIDLTVAECKDSLVSRKFNESNDF